MAEDLIYELRRWLLEVVRTQEATTMTEDLVNTFFQKATRNDLMELAILHNIWHSPDKEEGDEDLDELEAEVYFVTQG